MLKTSLLSHLEQYNNLVARAFDHTAFDRKLFYLAERIFDRDCSGLERRHERLVMRQECQFPRGTRHSDRKRGAVKTRLAHRRDDEVKCVRVLSHEYYAETTSSIAPFM